MFRLRQRVLRAAALVIGCWLTVVLMVNTGGLTSDHSLTAGERLSARLPTTHTMAQHSHKGSHEQSAAASSASTWSGTADPAPYYCYSAYWDNRPQLTQPRVVVTVVTKDWGARNVSRTFCRVEFAGGWRRRLDVAVSYSVYEAAFGRGVRTWLVVCSRPAALPRPPATVSLHHGSRRLCRVPVTVAARPRRERRPLGLCVSPVYRVSQCARCKPGNISAQLVPWIEMQRLVGVDGMTVYNHSMDEATARILRYYERIGFAEVIAQSSLPGDSTRVPNAHPLNDCLYRNMHKYERIMMIDLDEYIVPSSGYQRLVPFLQDLAAKSNVSYDGTQFWFANTYYYKDHPAYMDASGDTEASRYPMFKYQHRGKSQPFPGSAKSIIDPEVCVFVNPHMCVRTFTERFGSLVKVDHKITYLRHYKACRSNWWKPMGVSCEQIFKRMTIENEMLSFQQELINRVEMVEQDMSDNVFI